MVVVNIQGFASQPSAHVESARAGGTASAAELYLSTLSAFAPAGSLLDVRYRTSGHRMARVFLKMGAGENAALITGIGRRRDVYVGIAPRVGRSGGRDDLAQTAILWVDCDTPQATAKLRRFTPSPSLVIASGTPGNTHAYWCLAHPLDLDEVEIANRRLAAVLGADSRSADAAHVLRVPETFNHKHNPPRPVRLRRYSGACYVPTDVFCSLMPAPISAHASPRAEALARPRCNSPREEARWHRPLRAGDPLLLIHPAHYVSVLTGRRPGRDGKIACPFHDDRTPSLHAYPTPERGWTCFGCRTPDERFLGGDIYTLASLLWGIPCSGGAFIELRVRLEDVFEVHRAVRRQ
jgi:hypothetical protein